MAAKDLFINDLLLTVFFKVGMAVRCVGHHHLMAVGGVFEKIKDALFFHQTAGKVEIRLTILNAIVTWMERALNFKRYIQPIQHLLQNVRDVDVLENSALRSPGQKPKLRHDLQAIRSEDVALAASTLADSITNAIEITFLFVWEFERDRDLLAEEVVEFHFTGIFRQEVQVEIEKLRDSFVAGHANEQEHIFAKRRPDCYRSLILSVSRHICSLSLRHERLGNCVLKLAVATYRDVNSA